MVTCPLKELVRQLIKKHESSTFDFFSHIYSILNWIAAVLAGLALSQASSRLFLARKQNHPRGRGIRNVAIFRKHQDA